MKNTAVFNTAFSEARVFVSVSHFHPSLIFAGKAGARQSGDHFILRIPSAANIRLRW
jgi:hypothetical protein